MARQNSTIPKGAFPHLRQPHAEADAHASTTHHHGVHDHGAAGHGLPGGYAQSYEPQMHAPAHHAQGHGDHGAHQGGHGGSRDLFNSLRPDPQGLASRLEAYAQPGGHRYDSQRQDGYGAAGYVDPAAHGHQHPQHAAHGHAGQGHSGYGQGYDAYGRPMPAPGGYATHGGYAADPYASHHADPLQDPRYAQGYAAPQDSYGYDDPYRPEAAQGYGAEHPLQPGQEAEYDPEEYAEEPEPRRGPRAIVVVGALVAAIGLGGGLAYGYKSLTSGGSNKLPILRADSAPSKAQPTDPGGKQVAHTDKKFLNRLTEGSRPVPVSIQPPPPSERDAADGTRRVPTMVVNRDGSISPTASTSSSPPPMSGVPGMVIEGLTPRMPPPQLRESPQPIGAPSEIAAEEKRPPPAVRRVASAPPTVAADPPAAAPAPRAELPRAEPKRPVVRQAARADDAATSPAPAASASSGTSGFVAVLSSRKSHMEALKTFADMQQKYGGVLQGRTPDVREANLGDKGVWFRVVVGPPGSREAANGVCNQLKTAGYAGCWIMAY